jgi:hypothetical protein
VSYLSDYIAGETIETSFTTRDTTGLPTLFSGSPALAVYKDQSLVESTAGITLTTNYDGRAGLNHVTIDLSADAAFYSAGSDFALVVTAGTVAGTSVVGEVLKEFSIQNRSPQKPLARFITSAAGTITSVPTSSLLPACTDTGQYAGRILIFDVDTPTPGLRGQGAPILSSTVGGVLTIDPINALTRAAAAGDRGGIY